MEGIRSRTHAKLSEQVPYLNALLNRNPLELFYYKLTFL